MFSLTTFQPNNRRDDLFIYDALGNVLVNVHLDDRALWFKHPGVKTPKMYRQALKMNGTIIRWNSDNTTTTVTSVECFPDDTIWDIEELTELVKLQVKNGRYHLFGFVTIL